MLDTLSLAGRRMYAPGMTCITKVLTPEEVGEIARSMIGSSNVRFCSGVEFQTRAEASGL